MKIFCYTRNIELWRRKTAALPLEQRGIYSELIDWYYATGGNLPYDVDSLCRMIGATKRSERENTHKVIHNPILFSIEGTQLVQNMCEETLNSIAEKSGKARKSASARWCKNKDLPDAVALRSHSKRNANYNPLPNNQESITHKRVVNGFLEGGARGNLRLKNSTLESAKNMLPRADIYSLESEWRSSARDVPDNPDAAFLGWVKNYAKNHPELMAH